MTGLLKKFSYKLMILTIIVSALSALIDLFFSSIPVSPEWPYLIILFVLVTFFVHYGILNISRKKFALFLNYYLITTVARLLVYLIIMFIYSWLNREQAWSFIITFFIYYLIFTIFEVTILLGQQRKL